MQFHNQDAQLRVYKDGETIFGELLISGKVLNKEKTFENFNIKEYEGKTLDCVLNGKKLFYKNEVIKEYVNVFPPQTILDLKVENGMGTILFNGIPVETIKCDLNLPAYKINVQNDDDYTIVRYANLHQHTEGSLFDGITKISELANKTEYAGAITDHGNMFGWYEFKNSLEKKGKQPIIGEEFYMESFGGSFPTIEDNDDTEAIMFDKEKTQNEEGLNGEHLIVLAKNNQGIKNLFKLSSEAFLHYHKKPHITFELLKKYKEGLIVCSACIAGGINSFIKEYLKATTDDSVKKWIEDYGEFFYLEAEYQESPHSHAEEVYEYCHRKTRESIDWYYENFKDDFYLEYQDHHFPLEKLIMDELVRIRNEEYPQIKIVATCDAHYLNKEDAYVHELWLCNQTKRKIDDPKHMRFVGDGYYVHTSEEMLELFPVEYLDATLEVADKVHYEKEKTGYHLPHFPLPKGFENEVDYLRHVSFEGFKTKFKGTDKYTDPIYRERLKSEFGTIVQMGWPAYFLIVSDFIKWAEDENVRNHWQDYFPNRTLEEIPDELLDKQKIYVGAARGSGAGSLMNYCLGITKVEPIIYDLKFERFLNPDRISMPDIDTDFEDENRGKVLDYVRFKYGKKKVANIITFNTAAAKNSVKIINRVTCGSVAKGNEIADLIPSEPGMTIEKAMENSDFKNRYENDKEVKNIVDLAKRIEGLKTAQSIHACFAKGTMITTKDGSVPIEEIEVGNEVLTHTGQYEKVLKLSGRSVDETLYEIKSSNGFVTTCTGNHPYYVISKDDALNLEEKYEWVEAENLIPDKHLLVIPICEKTNKNNKIREIWKIIGMYAYCVTNLHTDKIIGLKENFAKEILDTLKANRCNGVISRYNNEFSISINWKDKKVIRDLEQEKIPTELLLESKENIKLFLEGWFYYSKSSFKASSKEFVSDMVHLINIGMELPLNIEKCQNKYFCSLAKEYEYHISQKYIYVPFEVSQKKESKITTVYNLEVEDDHSYVANGKIVHNCATLICDETITNYMPEVLMTDKDTGEKIWVTQMEGPICEELGCLKMDFLGLRTLGYVKEAIASIKKNTGIDIDYDQIPLNDSKVYKYLADGNTPSVFQCESDMFTTVIKKTLQDVKKDPDSVSGDECFERLVAMNALVRPGSNLFIDDFADRIMHPEHITYLVPELKPILKETYGIILYQEQTMRITRDLAGFSAGQADTVRKAMGKKKKYIMDEYKDYFVHGNKEKGIKGCVANGIPEDKAIELWDVMALAASYSFNKSHAVAYSMHSIRTAWLSCYYPYEYLTAVLNSFASNTDKLSQYLNYARQRKMNIHTPSINKSDLKFTTDGTTILAGLSGIKGVSSSAKNIIEDRNKNGVFESLENFLYRMSFYQNFDKRTLESLIYAGVLDEYEGTRKDKLNSLVAMSEYVKNEKAYRKKVELYEEKKGEYEKALILYNNNQGKKPRVPKEPIRPTLDMIVTGEEMPEFDKLMKELEYSGMFLTGNPMDLFKDVIKDAEDCSSVKKGKQNICGIVQELEKGNTKNGKTYYRFKLINNGSLSCISFDTEVIEKTVVKVSGNVSVDEFGASMVVNNVTNLLEEQKFINSLDDILIVTDDRSLAKQIQAINFPKGNRMVRILFEGNVRVLVKDVSININVMEKMNQIVGYRQIKTYERKQ